MSKFDMQKAIESIDKGLATIYTNEGYIRYLEFCSNFCNYSYNNILLIMMQCPSASYVAGYTTWRKMNRYVRKGETGIAILCPVIRKVECFKEPADKNMYHDEEAEKEVKKVISGFKIGYVFDLSQTDGDNSQLPVLVRGLAGNSEQEKAIYEALLKYVSSRYCVQEVTGISAKGSYNIETKAISVRADLEYRQKLKSLAHELSHAYDFELYPDMSISRNIRELRAESCAFILCMKLGIDTSDYSFGYLKSWLKDPKEISEIADSVQKISYKIISELAESSDFAFSHLMEE